MTKTTINATILDVVLVLSTSQPFFALVTTEDSWATKKPLPLPSWCIVGVNDDLCDCGTGDYANVSYWTNAVFDYDPAFRHMGGKETMPNERGNIAAAVCQNKITAYYQSYYWK